MGKSFVKTA